MPQFIRTAGYKIYFWSNEKDEPIHFHATKGNPDKDDTKFWILPNGAIKLAHNKSHIPEKDLSKIMTAMQFYYYEFIDFWKTYFGEQVKFYN